jgi:glycyl-tRNA synthetase beta chain
MPELFLEIGCEEIPAGFARQALVDLARLLGEALDGARLTHGAPKAVGAPRRLAVVVPDVAARQPDQTREMLGPPTRAAFDASGAPTKAALGFAKNQGVEVSQLLRIATPKGEYLGVRVEEKGRPAIELLPEILPAVLEKIPFQKSMRWAQVAQRFVRPVHWIVALLGGEVVRFSFAGVESGRRSRGHRFLSPEPFEVAGFDDYVARARGREVLVDPEERERALRTALAAAAPPGGKLAAAEELYDEVAFLVEKPFVIPVSFPREYLEIPPKLLLSVMEKQQRYFAYGDAQGRLLPAFAFVAGTQLRDPAVAARGALKVARSRFDDALFYLREDKKKKLADRVEELRGIVFLRGLGTIFDKVARVEALATSLGQELAPASVANVLLAAHLCKADLTTGVVKSFPELQGYIGREYAREEGYAPEVADALFEHYRPRGASDGPPEGDVASILSFADKLDSLAGCFRIGQEPTGTADPLALRRQTIGIVTIVLARGYHLSLRGALVRALAGYDGVVKQPSEPALERLLSFFEGRLRALWTAEHPADAVDAVLAAGFDDLRDARERLLAVVEFERRSDFGPVATTFKRVSRILKDAPDGEVQAARFEVPEEGKLHEATAEVRTRMRQHLERREFAAALAALSGLGAPVSAFFDKVLVMHEDLAIRRNRLALLRDVAHLSRGLLDFGRLQED